MPAVRVPLSRLFLTALLLTVFSVLAGCGGSADEEAASDRSPIRLAAVDTQGEPIVYEDLGGTDTVLWFWAPW